MEYDKIRGMTCEEMIKYSMEHPGEHITNTAFGRGEYIYYRKYYNIVEEEEVEGFFDEHNFRVEITCALSRHKTIYHKYGWYAKKDVVCAKSCKYQVEIPGVGICCKYYFEKNGSYRFPPCSCRECPFVHAILLDYKSNPHYAQEYENYHPTW